MRESGFADGRNEESPDSEQLEHTVAESLVRNAVSVEQIQDRVRERGQKAAFTLAEVLVTLGIIGTVAAIVLPSLISNINDRVNAEKIRSAKYKLKLRTT